MHLHIFAGLLLIIMSLASGCEGDSGREAAPAPTRRPPDIKIVALGDSLTAGLGVDLQHSYPALLQKKLVADGHDVEVVNAGVSGETTSGTLSRIDWILRQQPDIVILEIGANDGLRGIDPALVESNLDRILAKLKERGVVTVFTGMRMVWNLGKQYTDAFNAVYPRLAERHDVIFMPFFLEDVAAEAALNGPDGIHPNERGYERISENIYPYVLRALEKARTPPRPTA